MFKVYNFLILHLYIALCPHHAKSGFLLTPYIWPHLPSSCSLPSPFPTGNHSSVVRVYELVCLLICCSLYIPGVSKIIWFLSFLSWLILLSVHSQSPFVLSQMAVGHSFLWLSSITLYLYTISPLSTHVSKDTSVVFMSWLPWIILQCIWGHIYLVLKILFTFRKRRRVGEREGEKHQCMVASHVPPIGDLA